MHIRLKHNNNVVYNVSQGIKQFNCKDKKQAYGYNKYT